MWLFASPLSSVQRPASAPSFARPPQPGPRSVANGPHSPPVPKPPSADERRPRAQVRTALQAVVGSVSSAFLGPGGNVDWWREGREGEEDMVSWPICIGCVLHHGTRDDWGGKRGGGGGTIALGHSRKDSRCSVVIGGEPDPEGPSDDRQRVVENGIINRSA